MVVKYINCLSSSFVEENYKQEIKTKIEAELKKLKKELQFLEEATAPIKPENSLGRLTRMDAIGNKSVSEVSLGNTRKKIYMLEKSLRSVNEAGFGICSRCKNPIMIKRLMFMPETEVCTRCAS